MRDRHWLLSFEQFFIDVQIACGKAAESNFPHGWKLLCCRTRRGHGNPRRGFNRITVDAGADAWECERSDTVRCGDLNRSPVAGRQQRRFSLRAAMPDRPYRVDDVLRRQAIALREFCVAGLAATQFP